MIQVYGRVMHTSDDYDDTYIADGSLLRLFDKTRVDIPDWFTTQVDQMTKPDLPEFDPVVVDGRGSNAGNATGGTANLGDSTGRSRGALGFGSDSRHDSARGSRSAGSRAGGSGGTSLGDSNSRKTGDSGGSADDSDRNSHPLSDVWSE